MVHHRSRERKKIESEDGIVFITFVLLLLPKCARQKNEQCKLGEHVGWIYRQWLVVGHCKKMHRNDMKSMPTPWQLTIHSPSSPYAQAET
jgi:hypothetical protein